MDPYIVSDGRYTITSLFGLQNANQGCAVMGHDYYMTHSFCFAAYSLAQVISHI